MIISGGSRRGAKWFAGHVMRQDAGQQVRIAEARGLAGYDIGSWFRQMEAVSFGTRCDNYFYHANINPREDERLTEAQWDEAIDKLEHNLGLEGHARFVIEHEKEGRTHRHVFWSRIDPETMTAVSDSKTYRIHEKTADELEQTFGHEPTPRGRGPQGRNPDNWEVFRGKKSGIDPYDVVAELTGLFQQSDTGQSFAAAMEAHGYILAEGRRGLCVVDQAGKEHSLARRIDGARKKDVDARMADLDRSALPTVEEARALARERAGQRKEPEQQPTGFKPDAQAAPAPSPKKHGPSPFGEFAEELVHAVKNGMKGKEPELAAEAAEATPFERLAQTLAHGAKEAGPLAGELAVAAAVVEGEHLVKNALRGSEAPPRPGEAANTDAQGRSDSPVDHMERFARQLMGSMKEGTPVALSADPEQWGEQMASAMHANSGSDGLTFWERSAARLAFLGERAASWVKATWQDLVSRFTNSRAPERDEPDPGLER